MIGRIIADRYRLEARAGEGGIGAVYRARHLLIDRVVAIKILQPVRRGETHHRDWFLREARAANRVNHANIVDIYDFGDTEDGLYYLVMEYLQGEPLSHVIARGPIPLARTADILEQSCAALARAHDLGVVHRDIKSDNVFLSERGGRQDFVKVFDFGLASLLHDARLAPEGAVFGTPEYMSPEQTRGEEATPSSDLYAIGVLFFEMLTARLPFISNDRREILRMHQEAVPPKLRQIQPDAPVEAERIIIKLLEKESSRRYRDAHHLLEDIKALQRHAPRELAWDPMPALPQQASQAPVANGLAAAWALRAVMFGRIVSRANPRVARSPMLLRALDDLWRLSVSAARVESEISAFAKSLDAYERRSRDLRAQYGRQIEDLGLEESRQKRAIAEAQAAAAALRSERDQASTLLDAAWAEIARLEIDGEESALKAAYEKAGGARARYNSRAHELARMEAQIARMSASTAAMTSRILELRENLERQSDALDAGLTEIRRRMVTRGRDRAQILRDLERSAAALSADLEPLPECKELFEEMQQLVGPILASAQSTQTQTPAPQERKTIV
ncbi:MAG: protein kinase [Deltaproteobacteria bacterium]|nr:protein kinase [Deltaproteobacteria bacterium]